MESIKQSLNIHSTQEEIIKNGSVFTGEALVNLVYSKLKDKITNSSVLGDFGSGYGAFIEKFKDLGKRCFGTELDDLSFEFLTEKYPSVNFYHENSLINANRDKYNLSKDDELIAIGNPPYNDITSIFKKGEKGTLDSDNDLKSRDLGISFLKLYDKLNSKYVCVLHPLAYLIKKQNFNSLGNFKNDYKLLSATIFSSKEFEGIKKSSSEFPVVAALYERNLFGMDFQYIQNFSFDIFNSNNKFILNKIPTIDGKVKKYPTKGKNKGLQFYTLRDMNALLRNAGFVENIPQNGLEITDNNFFQYAWLFFLKENFHPAKNKFLYGNLSPLYTDSLTQPAFINEIVSYAYKNNKLVQKYYKKDVLETIYGPITESFANIFSELEKLSNLLN